VVYEEMGTEGLRLDRLKVNDLFNIIYIMRIYVCGRWRNVTLIVLWLFALHMRMFANSHIGPHSHVGREFELKPRTTWLYRPCNSSHCVSHSFFDCIVSCALLQTGIGNT